MITEKIEQITSAEGLLIQSEKNPKSGKTIEKVNPTPFKSLFKIYFFKLKYCHIRNTINVIVVKGKIRVFALFKEKAADIGKYIELNANLP